MVVLAEKSVMDELEATTCVVDEIVHKFKTKYKTITADKKNICKQLAEHSSMDQLQMEDFNKKLKSFRNGQKIVKRTLEALEGRNMKIKEVLQKLRNNEEQKDRGISPHEEMNLSLNVKNLHKELIAMAANLEEEAN